MGIWLNGFETIGMKTIRIIGLLGLLSPGLFVFQTENRKPGTANQKRINYPLFNEQ